MSYAAYKKDRDGSKKRVNDSLVIDLEECPKWQMSFGVLQGGRDEIVHIEPFLDEAQRVSQVANELCSIQKGPRWLEETCQRFISHQS
jgi:hypothetical protein